MLTRIFENFDSWPPHWYGRQHELFHREFATDLMHVHPSRLRALLSFLLHFLRGWLHAWQPSRLSFRAFLFNIGMLRLVFHGDTQVRWQRRCVACIFNLCCSDFAEALAH